MPAGSAELAVTVAVMACGVLHKAQPPPPDTVSQLPPFAVDATARKLNCVSGLAIVEVCGSGSAPAYGLTKDTDGIVRKSVWAEALLAEASTPVAMAAKPRNGRILEGFSLVNMAQALFPAVTGERALEDSRDAQIQQAPTLLFSIAFCETPVVVDVVTVAAVRSRRTRRTPGACDPCCCARDHRCQACLPDVAACASQCLASRSCSLMSPLAVATAYHTLRKKR